MKNQILKKNKHQATASVKRRKASNAAGRRRFIAARSEGKERPVAHRVWLQEVLLHALGHAFGVAIAGTVAFVLAAAVIPPAAQSRALACSAPVEFSNPKAWPMKAIEKLRKT
jgi:hypothetical protein